MKKAFVLFASMFLLGLGGICVLPGIILQEADNVTLSEQVVLGDSSMVEGVTIHTVNDAMYHLLWDTTLVMGEEPVTEFEFSKDSKRLTTRTRGQSWLEEDEYSCISLNSWLAGGWSTSSGGNIDIDNGSVRGLEEAYKELAAETAPGEEKSKQLFLNQYIEYFPVTVSLDTMWITENLSEAYSEFFKIPVPKDTTYTISVEKNKRGDITGIGGRSGEQNIYTWRTVSARSEEACYFSFYRFTLDGTRIKTDLIPGGFGIYRQPYRIEDGDVVMNPEELSMVYSLEEEAYPDSNMFLDVNAAGQLLIVTDTDTATKLQVVDLTTFEKLQQVEIPRPAGDVRFESVTRIKDDFLLLSYRDGYFALIDWNGERGYEHQFTMQVSEDDPIWRCHYVGQNDMDWNGTQLIYITCTDGEEWRKSCDFTVSVYDATGKVYQGEYKSSLLTEQERDPFTYWDSKECTPWGKAPVTVSWPEE